MARYDDIEEFEPDLDGTGLRIGIVMSRFNQEIGEGLLSSCTAALTKHGVSSSDVLIVTVPGALEAPLALQKMASSGWFDSLIVLGAVVRGETYHFEVVANESASGVTASASTRACRLPTGFSPPMTKIRRSHACRKRAPIAPGRRSRWPTF